MKNCLKCHQSLSVKNFDKDSSRKDGLSNWCKKCHKEYGKKHYAQNKENYKEKNRKYYKQNKEAFLMRQKKYRDQNPEKERARKKKYREQNVEKIRMYRKKQWVLLTYGITYTEKIMIYQLQNKKCAICNKLTPIDDLRIDHDHCKKQEKRKSIRGLLCHYCNSNLLPGYERAVKANSKLHNPIIDKYLNSHQQLIQFHLTLGEG